MPFCKRCRSISLSSGVIFDSLMNSPSALVTIAQVGFGRAGRPENLIHLFVWDISAVSNSFISRCFDALWDGFLSPYSSEYWAFAQVIVVSKRSVMIVFFIVLYLRLKDDFFTVVNVPGRPLLLFPR